MKELKEQELLSIQGGAGHYHWICRDGFNFTSKPYGSYAEAGAAADKHISKYPAHADDTSVFYCEKSSCK
jgi:hypothetical protein